MRSWRKYLSACLHDILSSEIKAGQKHLISAIIMEQSTRTFLSKEVVCPCLKRSFFVYLAENM